MIRRGLGAIALFILGLTAGSVPARGADASADGADFKEVYGLIQQHLAGVTPDQLNQTAVQSLVSALKPRVALDGGPEDNDGSAPALGKTSLFDGGIAYLRVERVTGPLAEGLRSGYQKLTTGTNQANGVVLDLRYARGDDYNAAVAAADLFLKKDKPLLDWGNGVVRSKGNPNAVGVPVAVLVNRETAGAAEALAAIFRETGAGLILGSRTAGQAVIAKEYPLKSGQRLRIATGQVRLADGSILAADGVAPDIAVAVSPEDERAYYADAFKDFASTNPPAATVSAAGPAATNRARPFRFNEAELVRERREGINSDLETAGRAEPDKPAVRDPALARALDVLKGLAVVRQSRF